MAKMDMVLVLLSFCFCLSCCKGGFWSSGLQKCMKQHEACLKRLSCRNRYDFDSVTNTYYKIYARKLTWFSAKAFCAKRGGRLLVLDNRKKFRRFRYILKVKASSFKAVQVGFYYVRGKYVWLSGKAVQRYAWGRKQPNRNGEYCGAVGIDWGGRPGMLHDSSCDTYGLPFVCEKSR